MDSICDVKGCQGLPLLGWRPLTERIGRKVCEQHWRRHQDKQDGFDLFEAFNFQRPARAPRRPVKTETHRCDCGRELQSGHKQQKPVKGRICKSCGAERRPGHTYCDNCARDRQLQANRERQKQHYKKAQKPNAFVTAIDNSRKREFGRSAAPRRRQSAL